jgi:predicted NBD/HSP70 family sugar kinase
MHVDKTLLDIAREHDWRDPADRAIMEAIAAAEGNVEAAIELMAPDSVVYAIGRYVALRLDWARRNATAAERQAFRRKAEREALETYSRLRVKRSRTEDEDAALRSAADFLIRLGYQLN